MRLHLIRDPAPLVSLVPALVAAASLLALAACSTTPSSTSAPDGTDASEPPPATTQPEQPAAPEPAPQSERPPIRIEPAPAAPEAPKSEPPEASAIEGSSAAGTDPAPTATLETAPEPVAAKPESDRQPERAPATVVLTGRVRLDVSQVEDVDDDSVTDTVIYFRPAGASVTAAPQNFQITTRRKRLIPDVLVVPVGSTVGFPNEDSILHNVFSVSSAANFDLGLYGEGESKSHTFLEPGLAVVHCNVHHAMRADVLVVDTPFYAQADTEGRFSIEGIAPATGELVAWHPRAGFLRRQVTLPTDESLALEMTLVRARIPDHLDKTGQPYRPERPRGR